MQSSEGAALAKPQGSLPKVAFQSESSPRTDFEEWVRTPLLLDPPSFCSSARLTEVVAGIGTQGPPGTKLWELPFPPL